MAIVFTETWGSFIMSPAILSQSPHPDIISFYLLIQLQDRLASVWCPHNYHITESTALYTMMTNLMYLMVLRGETIKVAHRLFQTKQRSGG